MGALDGRVAIVTGGGRGLGRCHVLLLALEGAGVVVNDVGTSVDGSGPDPAVAERVAQEVRAAGGTAVASAHDVADWQQARDLVGQAVDAFGELHVLVDNAGNLRDRFLVNLGEDEWDDVVRVHLKGHVAPLRWAAAYWRERAKAGRPVAASVVTTTSTSGLSGNPGQSAYGAAKAGIASLTLIAARELGRYGVRVNAVAPLARTRLTEGTPALAETVRPPGDPSQFDEWDPANVSPLVAWLATESCPATGRVFLAHGSTVQVIRPWTPGPTTTTAGRWTIEALSAAMAPTTWPEEEPGTLGGST